MKKLTYKDKLLEATGMREPYPTADVLESLADAAMVLFNEYDYDRHGYEVLLANVQAARFRAKLIREIMADVASPGKGNNG